MGVPRDVQLQTLKMKPRGTRHVAGLGNEHSRLDAFSRPVKDRTFYTPTCIRTWLKGHGMSGVSTVPVRTSLREDAGRWGKQAPVKISRRGVVLPSGHGESV